ncbi:MAG: glycosyltransferase family 2 protein [Candidatus Cohnella colombiensis]|uniref:Glycosyltransferase family 2 protein n=1 Tax=Candidatus Cohnella colombiensis TaxID=3121368 RepID=A0AA95ETQ2_9BACL|nr:MAG: glycosyltransferase family 2 protein [Cohnella sp.]
MCKHSLLIIVPAYNEAEGISEVIASIRRQLTGADVLVVNDGSADDTGRLAEEAGALTVHMPINLGIGGAVQTGYRYAYEQGYAYAAQIDGDGQHDPAQLHLLLDALHRSGSDMAVGSRYIEHQGYQSTFARKLGIDLLAKLLTMLLGRQVTDPTSGYRLCSRRAIALFANHYPTDYPEVEALVQLDNASGTFVEVPVIMKERVGGISSISAMKSVYYMAKVILAVLIAKSRKRSGRNIRYES